MEKERSSTDREELKNYEESVKQYREDIGQLFADGRISQWDYKQMMKYSLECEEQFRGFIDENPLYDNE